MKTIRYKSRGESVHILEQLLVNLGYEVYVSNYFGIDTHRAILDFQAKNNLVIDGIVGMKTWSKIIALDQQLTAFNDKLLSEDDLKEFATKHQLELAIVKAVNEVESNGKGFLVYGRPKILFEGHVFWRQLEKNGIQPSNFQTDFNKDVLYKKWTKKYYKGGAGEYDRLEKAAGMSDNKAFHQAAYEAASWGSFQIMGYHYQALGYVSIDQFVAKMYEHEREHLKAFGKYLEVNNLIRKLKNKQWASFARAYNGPEFATNKYDIKLEKAYQKYK